MYSPPSPSLEYLTSSPKPPSPRLLYLIPLPLLPGFFTSSPCPFSQGRRGVIHSISLVKPLSPGRGVWGEVDEKRGVWGEVDEKRGVWGEVDEKRGAWGEVKIKRRGQVIRKQAAGTSRCKTKLFPLLLPSANN
jgi:hypothetical protein